ncbi:MAG TPA: ABC transporter substrate-binding protein [Flavitalea sp.]|nr:ABC transporter substrate-binding protein [Flavitalea sp.]
MERMKIGLIVLLVFIQTIPAFSQKDTVTRRFHIAIFTPLYLDSAFDATETYRYGNTFPRLFNAGLEFYEGAQLAIDSLQREGAQLTVHVYDTKSANPKFDNLVKSDSLNKMDMVFGHVTANEARLLADSAAKKNIPFINVNFPNDAGVTNNPNFVILNSTLKTHCEGLYRFLQKNFALSPIVVFRKKGQQEDRVMEYFKEVEKTTASVPLKLKYVTLENNFTPQQLSPHLSPNKTTVAIAASLDISFAQRLCQQLATLNATNATTVFGMPTWDGADFSKPEYKDLEIYYSTPFYLSPEDKNANALQHVFKTRFYSRPSDMVYRGFETVYHFVKLLMQHKENISSGLSDKRHLLFTQFDIQPVIDKQTMTLDYLENKKLYFVKKIDGVVRAVY